MLTPVSVVDPRISCWPPYQFTYIFSDRMDWNGQTDVGTEDSLPPGPWLASWMKPRQMKILFVGLGGMYAAAATWWWKITRSILDVYYLVHLNFCNMSGYLHLFTRTHTHIYLLYTYIKIHVFNKRDGDILTLYTYTYTVYSSQIIICTIIYTHKYMYIYIYTSKYINIFFIKIQCI